MIRRCVLQDGNESEDVGKRNHRLHALCPYFAMFPPAFVRENLLAHTTAGQLIFDPFSGRGTTLLESVLNDRQAIACDVNPVAWCVSAAKAKPASIGEITNRLDQLSHSYNESDHNRLCKSADELPDFFRFAFHAETLKQLLFLRRALNLGQRVDRFIVALILGHLHGETNRSDHYLSNQMPHSISTKPAYSIKYWNEHGYSAPQRAVFELLQDRAAFRLSDGLPDWRGRASRCDVRRAAQRFSNYLGEVDAVITSPPYLNVTNFEEDQWLRLWYLGGPATPTYGVVSRDDRHGTARPYWSFLSAAWKAVAKLLKSRGVLICRIGTGKLSAEEIEFHVSKTVKEAWPKAELVCEPVRTPIGKRQTTVLNPDAVGCRYEIDFTFVCPQ